MYYNVHMENIVKYGNYIQNGARYTELQAARLEELYQT